MFTTFSSGVRVGVTEFTATLGVVRGQLRDHRFTDVESGVEAGDLEVCHRTLQIADLCVERDRVEVEGQQLATRVLARKTRLIRDTHTCAAPCWDVGGCGVLSLRSHEVREVDGVAVGHLVRDGDGVLHLVARRYEQSRRMLVLELLVELFFDLLGNAEVSVVPRHGARQGLVGDHVVHEEGEVDHVAQACRLKRDASAADVVVAQIEDQHRDIR